MVDHNLLVVEQLSANATLMAALGTFKIVAGQLPEKFDPLATPGTSPIVVVCKEGGEPFENAPIKTARVKIRVWAGANQFLIANHVYGKVFEALHGITSVQLADGFILHANEQVAGQDLTDPDTGWATVLSYYEVTARE